jgi:ATP-binding cassette subfamily C protein
MYNNSWREALRRQWVLAQPNVILLASYLTSSVRLFASIFAVGDKKTLPSATGVQSRLMNGIRETRPIFLTAIVFSFFINLLMFVSPLYMLQIYDRVVSSRSETTLIALTVLAGALLMIYALLEGLRARILVRAGLLFDAKIAGPVFEAIHQGNVRMPSGGHVQCLRDMDVVREFLTGSGLLALCDAPWFPIFVVACFILNPWFGVIALLGSLATLALTALNEAMTKKHLNAATLANARASQSANAVFRNTEVLQAMGMVENLKKIWLDQHDSVLAAQAWASDRSGAIVAFTKFFRMFLQTIILGTGAHLVIAREISPGAIVAGSILVGRALQPIELAVGNWKGFIAARSAYERLHKLFSIAGNGSPRMSLPKPDGALVVTEVVAAAPGRPQAPILKGVSFAVAPGEIVAVVGPSGAGKSSLARVLVGVWLDLRGSVRLGGDDLSHWNPQELGVHIGYLPQDVELFDGTIAQNISRFQDYVPEKVIEAASLAGCHELIQQMPEGYNTQIGEGGHVLSGGQKQRVALARALYGAPSLVVLDEPNANLDPAGEEALLRALQKIRQLGAIVVIITHKVNVLTAVDKILVLANGLVQAFGQRDAILPHLMGSQAPGAQPK